MTDRRNDVRAGLTRRLATAGTLIAAIGASLALAASAPAAKLGGKTTLAPNTATFEQLAAAGLTVAPVGEAKAGAKGIAFPVTSGKFNVEKLRGKIAHSGGLELSSHGTSLTLENYVIKVGEKNVLRAEVAGGGKVRFADLDLGDAKVRERGGKVVISGVGVELARKAAKALSATFGLPDLTGAELGEATVKVKP